MKFSLYSNKLDIMYNQLNSGKINADKFLSIRNSMNKINGIYDKEYNVINLQNEKNYKGVLSDDDNKKSYKGCKLNLGNKEPKKSDEDFNFFEKPKKILVKNKKMNLDTLTKKIAERYNICINDDIQKKNRYKHSVKNFENKINMVSNCNN